MQDSLHLEERLTTSRQFGQDVISRTFTLTYEQKGGEWVGICQELGINVCARTQKGCMAELAEQVVDYVNEVGEGEARGIFRAWGYTVHRSRPSPAA